MNKRARQTCGFCELEGYSNTLYMQESESLPRILSPVALQETPWISGHPVILNNSFPLVITRRSNADRKCFSLDEAVSFTKSENIERKEVVNHFSAYSGESIKSFSNIPCEEKISMKYLFSTKETSSVFRLQDQSLSRDTGKVPADVSYFTSLNKPSLGKRKSCWKSTKECSNCHRTTSPNWYLSKDKRPLCNACAKYLKRTGAPRPPQHWNKETRTRGKQKGQVAVSKCNSDESLVIRDSNKGTSYQNAYSKETNIDPKISSGFVDGDFERKKTEAAQIEEVGFGGFCHHWRSKYASFNEDCCKNAILIENVQSLLVSNTNPIEDCESPRRTELFDMNYNEEGNSFNGKEYEDKWMAPNCDKLLSLLSVVQLAKSEEVLI